MNIENILFKEENLNKDTIFLCFYIVSIDYIVKPKIHNICFLLYKCIVYKKIMC